MLAKCDMERIEAKLDKIIDFFGINKRPGKSRKDIDDFVNAKVLELKKRSKKRKVK